jgi:nitric oxide reductase NorD protein
VIRFWWRRGTERPVVTLDDVHRRIELLLTAMYGRAIAIVPADVPRPAGWLERLWRRTPRHLQRRAALAGSDGERIRLPRAIDAAQGSAPALAELRLLAIEQAERLTRGTAAAISADDPPLVRDLYLVRESAAIDGTLARSAPGLVPTLRAARADALAGRPGLGALNPLERAVEGLVRRVLAEDPSRLPAELAAGAGTPAESLAWARAEAERLTMAEGGAAGYRGIPPVAPWGTISPRTGPRLEHPRPRNDDPYAEFHRSSIAGSQIAGGGGRGSDDGGSGYSDEGTPAEGAAMQDPQPAQDGATGDRDAPRAKEATRSAGGAGGSGDAPVPPTRPQPPPSRAMRRPALITPVKVEGGLLYPEWDYVRGAYGDGGAIVRQWDAAVADGTWAADVLAKNGPVARRLRERFERMRARRARLGQQRDGDELDLTACVRALVDRRTGHALDDRLYFTVRPARREIAISLLVDISGSTHELVDRGMRVIDVEKIALLLASEALDGLGDRYSVLTFSGKTRSNVRLRSIKRFAEPNGDVVRRRIAALEPEGYTRLGAALRHATAQLAAERVGHRLLLILSDGKPNDADAYEGTYGVEDSRQAIAEARRRGVYPFCLTIDREGRPYLQRIFGDAGHTILRRPEQMPLALVKVVKQLLTE